MRSGSPEADALHVAKAKAKAKAKAVGGVIVTAESDQKPNSEKIPNICVAFGVSYMSINEFYKMLRNVHQGKSQLSNISICHELGKPTLV